MYVIGHVLRHWPATYVSGHALRHWPATYVTGHDGVAGQDYVLRRMMNTDDKGMAQIKKHPDKLERKDNLFRCEQSCASLSIQLLTCTVLWLYCKKCRITQDVATTLGRNHLPVSVITFSSALTTRSR